MIKVSQHLTTMRRKTNILISLVNPLTITLLIHNHLITIRVNWKATIKLKVVKKMYRILIIDQTLFIVYDSLLNYVIKYTKFNWINNYGIFAKYDGLSKYLSFYFLFYSYSFLLKYEFLYTNILSIYLFQTYRNLRKLFVVL
jgi:hypothetical protein